ncbi:MAG: hypothetical protein GY804_04490 [Alphaproteobacteria bacterium]|nr:hypothetical protein [Alphaproteobacteria bacterium]
MFKKILPFIIVAVIALATGILSGFLISKSGYNKSANEHQTKIDTLRTATRELQKRLNESEAGNRAITADNTKLSELNEQLSNNLRESEDKIRRTNVLIRNITKGASETKNITSGVIRDIDRVIEQVRGLEPD